MSCNLCPVACGADRETTRGYCGAGKYARIAKIYPHMYEEPPISGERGSGTVFFCGCSLRCVFCQNYELSRNMRGKEFTPHALADEFKKLDESGVHNINLVTPTQYVPQIVEAFEIYRPKIPVVYNTHAYESIETLRLIDLYVDIYLPDLKFFSPKQSERYTGKSDYFAVASEAVKFMLNSKSRVIGEDGMLKRGVVVRHLVMPLGSSDSKKIVRWFAENKKGGAYLSLMAQYTPFGEHQKYPELCRKITSDEYDRVVGEALSCGLTDVFLQEKKAASESFIPDWDY